MPDRNGSNSDNILRWQSMSHAELEREYSPSSAIGGNYQPFIEEYVTRSAASKAVCGDTVTLRYGDKPANLIDCVAGNKATEKSDDLCPLLVFIHGGYWQEGSRTDSFFGAELFEAGGIGYAAIGYTLAPEASLGEIVKECRQALAHLAAKAKSLGIDSERIYLAGSSAGAQLSAMCCCTESTGSESPVAGLILMSGIFDLEPLVTTYVNDKVAMNQQEAKRYSPIHRDLSLFPDTIITWGEAETLEFKRQSRAFASTLQHSKNTVECFESPTRNHFDIVHDLADDTSLLGRQVLSLINQ